MAKPPLAAYQGDYRIELIDSANIDSFGRLRVGTPDTQFSYSNRYGLTSLFVESWFNGTGSATHQPNASSVVLSTGGTASGAKATAQTRQYFRYIPGKSLLILQSGNYGIKQANVRKRRGYFDDQNGVFWGQDSDGMFVAIRSYVTGSVVETVVHQEDWNIDAFNGSGPSGVTLVEGKVQIYFIDIEWLGSGRVRFGLVVNGLIYYCHEFLNANNLETAYMTTANLPLRAEIENTGTASSSSDLLIICSTVIIEGGTDDGGYYEHSVSNKTTAVAVTTRRPILSIRPKALLNGIVNRATVNQIDFAILAATNTAFFELVYDGTLGGSPSWNSAGDNSSIEYDVAATSISGGEIIDSGFAPDGGGAVKASIENSVASRYPLVLDHAGANPKTLSIVATSFTGTANLNAALSFREYF